MIIKIAICDDEIYICSQLENMLIDILQEMNVKSEIEVFDSGESLCKELERQHFDLIFLDIELPKISGINVGRHIRNNMKDEITQIVYISGKDSYAMELFKLRPMDFLVKPLKKEEVVEKIELYNRINEQKFHFYEYKKRKEYFKVPMSEIIYFESKHRRVYMYGLDFEDVFYDSIANVYEAVRNQDFLLIHKSIIINYRFVEHMGYEEVKMINGALLPISQSKRVEVKAKYMKIRKRER